MSVVQVHVAGQSATITLNRPDKRNAITRVMLEELEQAFQDLHLEKRVRAVTITGAGSAFCAGMDLGEMQETASLPDAQEQWGRDAESLRDLLLVMLRFPKPIIAAINGPAFAGGVGLALASDIVVASDKAIFSLPEPRRGIIAGIVAPLLHFRIGAGHAARLLLTGAAIDAEEALRIGLAQEIATADKLSDHVAETVGEIAMNSPSAVLLTKRVLNEMIGDRLETLLAAGAAASAAARTTDDAREGLAAFLDKRDPKWE